jgi:fluoride exporter
MAVDPDVDLHIPEQRAVDAALLAAVAVGGVLGAETRYAVGRLLDTPIGGWPWDTWLVNVTGSFLLGVLMAVLATVPRPHRLVRPFLGVGVLGGFTTFSTAMVGVPDLLGAGRPALALAYLAGTAVSALLATALGTWLVRAVRGGRA